MKIIHMRVGMIHTNCYIVYDENTKDAAIIDPGDKAEYILTILEENDLKLNYIFLTHGHFDHIIAVNKIQEKTGAQLVIHKKEDYQLDATHVNKYYGKYIRGEYVSGKVTKYAKDLDQFKFGNLVATYIHTPGHTKGSCVIQVENALFTGDTLFEGECGRCDLDGGNFEQMLVSLKRLYDLEGDFDVYPGHEGFSTLEKERKTNRYMLEALSK